MITSFAKKQGLATLKEMSLEVGISREVVGCPGLWVVIINDGDVPDQQWMPLGTLKNVDGKHCLLCHQNPAA